MSEEGGSEKESHKNGFVVKITNIPGQIDESSLKSVMGHFGKVEMCKLIFGEMISDPATAWVQYKSESEVEKALKADGKLECGGCKLKITRWEGAIPSERTEQKRKLTESSTCQDSCWFCLANDECETHMISYVSKHCYVAVAKGSLSDMHSLVVPIYHYPNLGSAPLDVQMDIKKVIDRLFDIALSKGNGAIAFERFVPLTMKVAMHTQVQVLEVPSHRALQCFNFVDKSQIFSDATRIPFESEDVGFHGITSRVNNKTQYLYLQAVGKSDDSGEVSFAKCLWVFDRPNYRKIPTHFGREIALSVLSHRDLEKIKSLNKYVSETNMKPGIAAIDWHNCVATKEEETESCKNISKMILGVE
ncbi:Protein similar to CwfJ C-terminus 1 family protein [Theileria parva strain Muguga]|uniref:Protein similar to CwfJ C-terminus 1 family protein n=1 Tax=Theileria parva strain Muguga TaxID=333668 RepID=UPI001C61D0F7|nr:Protein similar to CwfJ C-terminus 1 family protein [Theileria parva strain Muguga]EAN34139.2 Protein similar to CwfJ C-terminus 1 family protein [Theileria parva strain Muguga]